jgi:hypothetical protein
MINDGNVSKLSWCFLVWVGSGCIKLENPEKNGLSILWQDFQIWIAQSLHVHVVGRGVIPESNWVDISQGTMKCYKGKE